jgi:hypothetical protein
VRTNLSEIWDGADGGSGSYVATEDPYTLRVCQETQEHGYEPGVWYAPTPTTRGLGAGAHLHAGIGAF